MEYLQNQLLADATIKFYTDGSNIGWDSGLIDHTRNIFSPYMLKFDHLSQVPETSYRAQASIDFTEIDHTRSRIKPKSIADYQNDVYTLKMLRNKIYLMEGLLM